MVEVSKAKLVGRFVNGSDEWHGARKGNVGGSQVGSILGLNPWESAVTTYYKMRGEIPDSVTPSMAMRLGTKLEEPILEVFFEEHPEFTRLETGTYVSIYNKRFTANPDALFEYDMGKIGVVEVKFSREFWHEIPKHYEAQLRWYLGVMGLDKGVFAVLAGSSYQEFEIWHDEFQWQSMVAGVNRFLDHVDAGSQPVWDGSESTYETVRALNPNINPDEIEELGDLGMYLKLAFDEVQDAELKYRELQSRTLDAMGAAKFGAVNDDIVLYRTQRKDGAPYLQWKKKGK